MNNGERRNGGDFREAQFYIIESAGLSEGIEKVGHKINQDSHLIFTNGELFTAVVSDGIGGNPGGEVAAQLITTASREVADRPRAEKKSLEKILKEMIKTGDTDIRDAQNSQPQYNEMGATFAGLLIRNGEFACANVGDTRIYCKRGKILMCLSKDHTLGAEMLEKGATPEEATHKNHILTQAIIGYGIETIEPNYRQMPIETGEIFLLISDGLHTKLTNNELFDLIDEQNSAETIAQKIMAAAKERGLTDDATVVAVKVTK